MANVQGEAPPDLIFSKPLKKFHDETTEESNTEESFKTKLTNYETGFSSSHQEKAHADTGAYQLTEIAESNYGTGNITKSIGVLLKPRYLTSHKFFYDTAEDYNQDYTQIGDLIRDQSVKVKVRPLLISFSGLPESSKSTALRTFLDHHVHDCPANHISITRKSIQPGEGITQYELIADGSDPHANFTLSEAMKESYFAFGLLTAFKNILAFEQGKPVIDVVKCPEYFEDEDLESCLSKIHQNFINQSSIPKTTSSVEDKTAAASGLAHSLPECLALINIWDHSISNVVRHLLSALQGHLYNHYMFLFLDLERDLKHLDKPPEITKTGTDGAIFMKWRPRLHYLLRSAWATEKKGERKVQTCTLFAKNNGPYTKKVKKDMDDLVDLVNPVAKHIGVANLLDKKIEAVNVKSDHKRIYRKIQRIADDVPIKDIPLSWVFLRSSFLFSQKVFISKKDLKKKAKECGINEISLLKFCKFYTSFGSIIDLSLTDSQCELVLVKPITFLKLLSKFIYPNNDTFEQYPSMKLGIVPEEVCEDIFDNYNWFSVMTALESLNLVTRITKASLELPAALASDFFPEQNKVFYYIPLCCRGPPITEVDTNSIHLITSIDTPHFFKQVTIVKHLLSSLETLQPKLLPCTNINQTIIKATTSDTTVTFAFHSPVIKIHLDKPDSLVLSHVVQAFNYIAKKAFENSEIKVKYKFVRICAEKEVQTANSLLSSFYHVLPYDGHCETCIAVGRNDELLKAWNEVLKKNQVPEELKPTGLIKSSEMTQIAEKITKYCKKSNVDLNEIVMTFVPDYKTHPQLGHFTEERLLNEILDFWQSDVSLNKNGGPEPRRSLAEKLSKLGYTIFMHFGEYYIQDKFEKLAKSIDVYWDSPFSKGAKDDQSQEIKDLKMKIGNLRSQICEERKKHHMQIENKKKQLQEKGEELQETNYIITRLTQFNKPLTNDDILKLSVILQSIKDDWYSLGEALDVEKALLNEINEKGQGLECLLRTWCEEGERTLTQLEKGLKMIGKNELIPGLFHLNLPLRDVLKAEKKSFVFQGESPQFRNWEQYGLKISIPEGTLSSSEAVVEVSVIALVGGQFVFPKNTKLVSAVYAISLSKPILKPLRLQVQHCVNLTREDQTKYLNFAIAPLVLSSPGIPYQFELVNGGQFTVGSYYGSIFRDEFCLVCIVGDVYKPRVTTEEENTNEGEAVSDSDGENSDSENSGGGNSDDSSDNEVKSKPPLLKASQEQKLNHEEQQINEKVQEDNRESTGIVEATTYAGLVYYNADLAIFRTTKHLNALIEYIETKYSHAEIGQDVYFSFKEINGFIELKFDTPQRDPHTGWTIRPHIEPSRFYQHVIDKFGADDTPVPSKCLISVQCSPHAVPTLHYGIPLEGVVHPVTFFIHRSLRTITTAVNLPKSPTEEREPMTKQHVAANPIDEFKGNIPKLSSSLGAATAFLPVAEEFLSKGLITFDLFTATTSTLALTPREKGSKVIIGLYSLLKTSPKPEEVLSTICDILIEQDDPQLRDIGLSMRI